MREKLIVETVDKTITDDESSYISEKENKQIDAAKIPTEPTDKT